MNNQEIQNLINDIEETVELLEADLAYCDNKSQREVLKSEMDLFNQAVKCIKHLQENQQSAWISVDDKLPEFNRDCWAYFDDGGHSGLFHAIFSKKQNTFVTPEGEVLKNLYDEIMPVTHWQYLPDSPEESEDE